MGRAHSKAAIIGRAGADPLFIMHLTDKQRIEANTCDQKWVVGCCREGTDTRRGNKGGDEGVNERRRGRYGEGGASRPRVLPRHEIVVYSKCHACLISQNYGSSCTNFNGSSVAMRSLPGLPRSGFFAVSRQSEPIGSRSE